MSINLFLDTKDSINNSTPADTNFVLKSLMRDDSYNTIGLKSISFVNLLYAVNQNTNTLIFQEDGTASNLVATLTIGNYTATELGGELKTQLESAGSNVYTITYNASTFKYNIATDGTSIKLMPSSTCLNVIGFQPSTSFIASNTTSDNVIRLDGTQYISVIVSMNVSNIASNGYSNIIARIPVTEAIGDLLYHEPSEITYQAFNPGTIDGIALRLVDDSDRLISLPSNCQVQYVFTLQQR